MHFVSVANVECPSEGNVHISEADISPKRHSAAQLRPGRFIGLADLPAAAAKQPSRCSNKYIPLAHLGLPNPSLIHLR